MTKKGEPDELTETVETSVGGRNVSLGGLVATVDGTLPPVSLGTRICLVEIHGEQVERRVDLTNPRYSIGRSDAYDIVVGTPSVSRLHATLEADGDGYEIVDQESTNGTYVNERRVHRCPLRHDDLILIGNTAFRFLAAADLEPAVSEVLSRISRTDGLTQIANRTALEDAIDQRSRAGRAQCLLVLDLDDFSGTEARHGALAMDRVVSLLAGLLKLKIRRSDLLARIDRPVFALLLDTDDEPSARRKADSLRRHIAQSTFRYHETEIPVSVRVVVSTSPAGPETDSAAIVDTALRLLAGPRAW